MEADMMIRDADKADNKLVKMAVACGRSADHLLRDVALHFPNGIAGDLAWAELKRREALS